VEILLGTAGGDEPAEFIALWDWLRTERSLAGRVRALSRPPGAEELGGGGFELLAVTLGSGGAVSVVARSLFAWLSSRRPEVTISVKASGKMKVITRGMSVEEIVLILQESRRTSDGS
jgi:hypothetical protein